MLDSSFYSQPTIQVAQQLLGKILVRESDQGIVAGYVVETEAYLGAADAAAHSYRGETARTKAMFGPVGKAYVYFTYGMHYCFNVVTGNPGEAVLIRAVEPIIGIELMTERRKYVKLQQLTNGPAKVAQAFAIDTQLYGTDLGSPPLFITDHYENKTALQIEPTTIVATPRIGISKAQTELLRFYVRDSEFVSK